MIRYPTSFRGHYSILSESFKRYNVLFQDRRQCVLVIVGDPSKHGTTVSMNSSNFPHASYWDTCHVGGYPTGLVLSCSNYRAAIGWNRQVILATALLVLVLWSNEAIHRYPCFVLHLTEHLELYKHAECMRRENEERV